MGYEHIIACTCGAGPTAFGDEIYQYSCVECGKGWYLDEDEDRWIPLDDLEAREGGE